MTPSLIGSQDRAALPAEAQVVVVGGGIAGLATAWQLGELGVQDVVLVEAESALAMHASGRNASIFLPLEESPTAIWLAARSRDLFDSRIGTSWLSAQGVTLVSATSGALEELRYTARRLGVYHERWAEEELATHMPVLRDGECTEAIHLPLGGVIDTHLVLSRMRAWAIASGVKLFTGARVRELEIESDQLTGVTLDDGHRIAASRVVLAAGAWGAHLGAKAGSSLELTPLRRNLVKLRGADMPSWNSPVTWRIDAPIYYRPEGGGLLASPCDEVRSEPGAPTADPKAYESVLTQLAKLAPALAEQAELERAWACLRTVSSDRELVVGADTEVRGLYWCAGLGGRGMSAGAAAAELLARTMLGLAHPLSRPLSPERFG